MRSAKILHGDALAVLSGLPDASVQCVVTSPPYWGLRDYGDDGQIGLEPTPEAYVERMVEVFREVRRVLRADGTVWLNLGDCYATFAGRAHSPGGGDQGERFRAMGAQVPDTKNPHSNIPIYQPNRMPVAGLKPKDLVGIPWRVAFALQADGWWLRSDIIWAKPNPMPESVTDRPTKSHEYIFLLTKSERYYYDHNAVREDPAPGEDGTIRARARTANGALGGENKHSIEERVYNEIVGANARSVWTITTKPYPEAHFATFPPELPERCIRAGTDEGDTVLDPFCGAGTTGLVALRLGRDFIGVELNRAYCDMAMARLHDDAPLLNNVGVA